MNDIKLGVLYCAYSSPEYIQFINPWIKLKDELNIVIAGANGMFREMHELDYEDNDEETIEKLLQLRFIGDIDFLYVQNDPATKKKENFIFETEAQIRDRALQYLLEQNCTHILLLDSDEAYTEKEIRNIIESLEKDKFTTWFRIEFKNLTFSEKTYTKNFRPPRIFRVISGDNKLSGVYYDNDCVYIDKNGNEKGYLEFSSAVISLSKANPLHYTWLSDERSKKKVAYQVAHFSHGAGCSYKWNEEKNCLEFNENYFKITGQSKPILYNI